MEESRSFWEAGFRVFGLHGVTPKGACACGDPDCKAVLKHPLVSNWQHTPHWSEEQLDVMEEVGQFDSGYGILLRFDDEKDILVVDVDARNGGLPSYDKLLQAIPEVAGAGLIANTGSGGGSKHLYFFVPKGMALMTKHPEYPGVDFKSGAAYVVGPGSLHKSGNRYELVYGGPDDVESAPQALLDLIRKPERHRADLNGQTVDVSHADLADMLKHIDGFDDYETWVRVGMALHHASDGTAVDLWDAWSQQSMKYDANQIPGKWHSFGKSANPVQLGTLVYYAQQGGWIQPVTFTPEVEFDLPEPVESGDPFKDLDTMGIDLLRPPGLTGRLAEWINQRGRRPRERLASVAALFAMGNIAGLHYTDDLDGVTTNMFVLNVAGSGSGKEAVLQAVNETLRLCGMAPAIHGAIKSEQEIIRNLTRNQAAIYVIDEIGFLLQKIKSAQSKGGAIYMEGVIGTMMSAFSKADGYMQISGDVREAIKEEIKKDLTRIEKQISEKGETPFMLAKRQSVEHMYMTIDEGLDRPFLSMSGYTTAKNFADLVDYEAVANGFMGRALLNVEPDSTPEARVRHKRPGFPEGLKLALQQIATGGSFDMMSASIGRVDYYGPRTQIPTEAAAVDMLEKIIRFFDRQADEHKERSGMEALMMRGYELVAKISLTLAVPSGIRTVEHVLWALALVKRDIDTKLRYVIANDSDKSSPALAMRMRIEQEISGENGETMSTICTRLKKYKKSDVENCVELMVKSGAAEATETIHKYNKRKIVRYKLKVH